MKSNSIYIASRYSRKDEMRRHADKLRAAGFTVTSQWLEEPHNANVTMDEVSDNELFAYAVQDLTDIDRADTLIFFAEDPLVGTPRGGRHVEFGFALARDKRILVVGPKENIFHHLLIKHSDTFEGVLAMLNKEVADVTPVL